MRTILVSLALCLLSPFVFAQSTSFNAEYDDSSRIRRVEFKDNLVLRIVGYSDRPMVLELDPSEPILAAAGGNIALWEVSKVGNRLFMRPLEDARPATIVAVTKTRSYVLDLVPGNSKKMPAEFVTKIIVTYPSPPVPVREVVIDPSIEANRIRDASTPLAEAKAGAQNRRYSIEIVSEKEDIKPREVFDDGRFTYFKFPQNMPIPAIYKSTPGSAEEWLVNSHKDGEYVVLHSVAQSWNLRLSGSTLGIFNDAYDAMGVAAESGSTIKGLKREFR